MVFAGKPAGELQQRWRQAGSQLLLPEGNAIELLPRLAQQLARVVWLGTDVEPLRASATGSWQRR